MPRGRTRLTTPPGQDPAPAAGDGPEDEYYLPALEIPTEPRYPSRFRWLYVTAGLLVLVAAIGFTVVQLTSASRTFDPSLQFPGRDAPASPAPTSG